MRLRLSPSVHHRRLFHPTLMGNDLTFRCQVLCHNLNLCCVIQSIYELGIEADFRAE